MIRVETWSLLFIIDILRAEPILILKSCFYTGVECQRPCDLLHSLLVCLLHLN